MLILMFCDSEAPPLHYVAGQSQQAHCIPCVADPRVARAATCWVLLGTRFWSLLCAHLL